MANEEAEAINHPRTLDLAHNSQRHGMSYTSLCFVLFLESTCTQTIEWSKLRAWAPSRRDCTRDGSFLAFVCPVMPNHEAPLLENFQAIAAKRLERIRNKTAEDSHIDRCENVARVSFAKRSLTRDLVPFSLSEAALVALTYDLNRGLSALEDIKAIWTRRSSEAKIRQRRITNSKLSVGRLPNEVLSLVFRPEPLRLDQHPRAYEAFRDAAASVCFRFRQVILSTPSCWSNIWIDAARRMDVDIGRTYLQRSKCGPLHLTFHNKDGRSLGTEKQIKPVAVLLRLHTHRIRALSFIDLPEYRAISSLDRDSLPELRHLRIQGYFLQSTLRYWHALQNPLLTLEIIDLGQGDDLPTLPSFSTIFNTTSLTRLVLRVTLQIQDVVAFLKCCPVLEDVTWTSGYGEGEYRDDAELPSHVNSLSGHTFRHLQKLKVGRGLPHAILGQANAPQLRELDLEEGDPEVLMIPSFLRSQTTYPSLHRMRLCCNVEFDDLQFTTDDFEDFVGRARNVEHFAVKGDWQTLDLVLHCLSDEVSRAQRAMGSGDAAQEIWRHPWPLLKTLEIWVWEVSSVESEMSEYVEEILRENDEVEVVFYRPKKWSDGWRENEDNLKKDYPSRIRFESHPE